METTKMTVKDVAKGKANLTDIRFRLVISMLQNDEHLTKRVKEYLKWYH